MSINYNRNLVFDQEGKNINSDIMNLEEYTLQRRRYVRVVKETDLKSVGLRPRRFDPCCRRFLGFWYKRQFHFIFEIDRDMIGS